MSEYSVEAYYLEPGTITAAFGSGDALVLRDVLADPDGLIAGLSGRFGKKTLPEAIGDLVNGTEQDGFPFHYSFGTWMIVSVHNDGRPANPRIGPPFVDLYDLNQALANHGGFPKLLQIFKSLNNEVDNEFPHQLKQWSEIPGFAYVEHMQLAGLAGEVQRMRADLDTGADWTSALDDPEDIGQILDWLDQAALRNASLCLVMDGEL